MNAATTQKNTQKRILSLKNIEEIALDVYHYANGKINPLIYCADFNFSNEGYKKHYNASMFLNTITIYTDTLDKHMRLNNMTLPRQRGFIAEVVIHELSHLNQYKSKTTYSFNRGSVQYRNYKDIEKGNDYNTLLFIRENKNDLIKAIRGPVLFDQTHNSLSYEELKSLVNRWYISMSREKAMDELDMICQELLHVPLHIFVDRLLMDINSAYNTIRIAIDKSRRSS
jgi:hypothetical protein